HRHYKNAGDKERMMRDFMTSDVLSCPFECSHKVSPTNKRGHLRKHHYDIYFKYCRTRRSSVAELKERKLGPTKGDRVCLICHELSLSQMDMLKHLEK
ncbi:hypothetical protein PMAYCL1PPCAC_28992, partial [Pristionchus mayeri]